MAHARQLERNREEMVAQQIARRGVGDRAVLDAVRATPREAFVPEAMKEFSYEDSPLPIGERQTISQPFIVARMAELAGIEPGDKVLEVGAGSGYAAAVLGQIAGRVFAIERHKSLAEEAEETIRSLGYGNIEIIHGDGSRGLAKEAPFVAIIVSAGGERLPEALKSQLAIGGRLVIPLKADGHQMLMRVRRADEDEWETEEHGAVAFVPLVEGEAPAGRDAVRLESGGGSEATPHGGARVREQGDVAELIAGAAEPFVDYDELARMAERFADRKVVLLGEATHGTAEFYEARAAITEQLVARHGFSIVGLEADWPDARIYDAYVRGYEQKTPLEKPFARFPEWMWRNRHVYEMMERMKAVNAGLPEQRKAMICGLDIYSLSASIDAVLGYLDEIDPDAAAIARERYACLTPFRAEPAAYGRMALSGGYRSCENAVTKILGELLEKRLDYLGADGEEFFNAEQNARITADAENYYRAIYYGAAESWNLRDQHMFETMERVLEHRGPEAKAVVWAHNSHIGDARETEMGWARGEHNIGQLCRERFSDQAALIGFGTARGEAAAGSSWGDDMQVKTVRPPHNASFEHRCDLVNAPCYLLDMGTGGDALREALSSEFLERAIGVVYRPETELASHYFEARPARQFDAWVWFENTRAVEGAPDEGGETPVETFPFGV